MAVPAIVNRPDSSRNTPTQKNQFLNPLEAADFLGVSHQTLARWRMQKVGPAYSRLNDFTIRYSIEDLLAYVTVKKVQHEQ